MLYKWYQQGKCGISLAATPGSSNHEDGRAAGELFWGPLFLANSTVTAD